MWRTVQGDWREGLPLLLVGLVFAGFASAGMALMPVGRRKLKELEQLQARHPEQPWLWRREWAGGRIQDSARSLLLLAWIFALFWNLISIPVGWLGIRTAVQENNPKVYLALIFPLIGCGLLVCAVRLTIRSLKYGTSWLELSTIPGAIGRRIAGTIRIPGRVQPEGGFDATLTCLHQVTTRGKDSSTSERILWQEESRVRGELSRDAVGPSVRVPVSFRIPADAAPSEFSNVRDQIVWRLTLSASVPGVDYHSSFEVPVFRTGEASSDSDGEDSGRAPVRQPYRQPGASRITVSRNQRGTEVFFAAARNPGVAIGSTLFTVLWVGLVAGLVIWGAPLLFPIVFGLFAVLLVVSVLQFWLGVSRVLANRSGITVSQGYLFPGRDRTIDAAQIADVTVTVGMQAGTTPYYDVVIMRKNRKPMVAGRSVRHKREAEWLAETLRAAVGLTQPAEAASTGPLLQA